MDEREVQKLVGKTQEIVGRADRMRSRIWTCLSCGAVTHSEQPIQIPAPCIRCGGISFRAIGIGNG